MEFNETWQEARSQRPLLGLCFFGRSEKQDGRPGLWLAETFSTSPLKPLNGIQRNLTGRKISTLSTKFVFFRLIWKTRWPPWPLIGWDTFDFSSKPLKGIQRNLTESKISMPSTKFKFFRPIGKARMPPLLLIGWDIFDFSSETAVLNVLYQSSGRSKKQYGGPCLWLAGTYFDFSSETAEWNSTKLDRKQSLNALCQVCVFWPIEKTRWPP